MRMGQVLPLDHGPGRPASQRLPFHSCHEGGAEACEAGDVCVQVLWKGGTMHGGPLADGSIVANWMESSVDVKLTYRP